MIFVNLAQEQKCLTVGVSSQALPFFVKPLCVMPYATPDVARAAPTLARRRRERRIRSFFRHEQMAVKMAVISAQHHSAQRCCSIATQTDDYVTTSATFFNMSDGDDSDEPAAPVTEYVAPAPDVTCTAPAPVIEYVPASTFSEPVPVIEHVSLMTPMQHQRQ